MTPALADLQLTTVGSDAVQVDWKVSEGGPSGYLLTWEGQQSSAIGQRSTVYLPPDSQTTRLTNLPPSARVCVSPIYHTGRGDGLCCTANFHSGMFMVHEIQKLKFIWNIINIKLMHRMSSVADFPPFTLRFIIIWLPVIAPLNRHCTLPNMEVYCKKNADYHP